jgi:hypothetical protein
VEPLLKVFLLADVQADESESFGDILNLLKAGLSKHSEEQLLKTMSKCLYKVQEHHKGAQEVARELIVSLQEQIRSNLTLQTVK